MLLSPRRKIMFVECSYQRCGKFYCGPDIKLLKGVCSSDSYFELNQYSTFRCLLYLLKVVLISVERSDSLCKIASEDIVKFPGEPGGQS